MQGHMLRPAQVRAGATSTCWKLTRDTIEIAATAGNAF